MLEVKTFEPIETITWIDAETGEKTVSSQIRWEKKTTTLSQLKALAALKKA
ncbi:hypothetical protein KAU11_09585 [Candidatus Babeliales bacterium]|nr:hypothetical protein [Candidatus Babeliales bacterium]